MLPMNSSTVRPLSVLVVTFLKVSSGRLGLFLCHGLAGQREPGDRHSSDRKGPPHRPKSFMFTSSLNVDEGSIVLMTAL